MIRASSSNICINKSGINEDDEILVIQSLCGAYYFQFKYYGMLWDPSCMAVTRRCRVTVPVHFQCQDLPCTKRKCGSTPT